MARRFARDQFLFPYNLRPGRIRTAAKATDPFERAYEGAEIQAPQRPYDVPRPDGSNGFVQLARGLGVAADNLGQAALRQKEEQDEQARLEGIRLARESELEGNKQTYRQLISRARQEDPEAARELLEMNPHVQRGFDQTRARSASLQFNSALQSAYAANPLVDEENSIRLHDLELEDDRYQDWIRGFTQNFNESNGLNNIDPTALATIIPAQQDVSNRVNQAHSELRSTRRLLQYEDSVAEFTDEVLYDLHNNADWIAGQDNLAPSVAAELITQQLDEAVSLGFGGGDLDNVYSNIVAMVINAATVTNNPALLQVAELVEIGRPDDRQSLLSSRNGSRFRQQLETAERSIIDREYQIEQRDRVQRDQRREDSMSEGLELIAQTAAIYQNSGRTPQARASLENVVNNVRVTAAENGWSKELNSVLTGLVQDAVDNQQPGIINYGSVAAFEEAIITGAISGTAARNRAAEMYRNGEFGNPQQAAETYVRLSQYIKGEEDQATNAFMSEADRAAQEIGRAFTQRAGYTEDERGRLVSIKETLIGNGWTPNQIQNLVNMTGPELESWMAQNPDTPTNVLQAMNLVVNEGLNPLITPDAFDQASVIREETEFKNLLFRGLMEFRENNGRDMTPVERQSFIDEQKNAFLSGQTTRLDPSNPLSSVRRADGTLDVIYEEMFNAQLGSLSDSLGNPQTDELMTFEQIAKANEYFSATGRWHPAITDLAEANNMSPQGLIQSQMNIRGVEVDDSFFQIIGIQTPARSTANLPNYSVYTRDLSQDYSRGAYTIFKGHLIDDYSGSDYDPGSWDFTLIQNDNDLVNIPSPFTGTVTHVQNGCQVGDTSCGGYYGNYIEIKDNETGMSMFIGHLEAAYLNVGDVVRQGQAIGRQGSTGSSTGPHIHAEVKQWSDTAQDAVKIADRSVTEPVINEWFSLIESGSFLPENQSALGPYREGTSSIGLRPNRQPPKYGHQGYDLATDVVDVGNNVRLAAPAAEQWRRMENDARYEGVTLIPVDGFRTIEDQEFLWNRQLARQKGDPEAASRLSAPPGHSQHHTGMAVDITDPSAPGSLTEDFENTPAFQWLKNNASRYGFEMSFDGSSSVGAGYEPWQWVYTGGQGGPVSTQSSSSDPNVRAQASLFRDTARDLGVDTLELAAVAFLESSLGENQVGGDGGNYQGYFQFGPEERNRYGVYAGQPLQEQMEALKSFLHDRGYRPGMGIGRLYATILGGNPDATSAIDSNGTSANRAVQSFRSGGWRNNEARRLLGL